MQGACQSSRTLFRTCSTAIAVSSYSQRDWIPCCCKVHCCLVQVATGLATDIAASLTRCTEQSLSNNIAFGGHKSLLIKIQNYAMCAKCILTTCTILLQWIKLDLPGRQVTAAQYTHYDCVDIHSTVLIGSGVSKPYQSCLLHALMQGSLQQVCKLFCRFEQMTGGRWELAGIHF